MRCFDCKTRSTKVEYLAVTRRAGGDYRRPHRRYRTTMCRPCAEREVEYRERLLAERRGVGRSTPHTNVDYVTIYHALGKEMPRATS